MPRKRSRDLIKWYITRLNRMLRIHPQYIPQYNTVIFHRWKCICTNHSSYSLPRSLLVLCLNDPSGYVKLSRVWLLLCFTQSIHCRENKVSMLQWMLCAVSWWHSQFQIYLGALNHLERTICTCQVDQLDSFKTFLWETNLAPTHSWDNPLPTEVFYYRAT